jgi:hypothetical protein
MNDIAVMITANSNKKSVSKQSKILSMLLLTLLIVASIFPLWATSHHLTARNDDTYITLTYVKSLVAGEGWRYNAGAETLGTTTPLFALVVTALSSLLPMIAIEQVAVGWSTFCWLATAWLLFLQHESFGLRREGGALIALLILLQGRWWLFSLGMEATFLVFGLTLTTWLTARRYAFSSGFVSGLLFLIRPEGLAMVPLAGLWLLLTQWAEKRLVLARFAGGALLPLGIWGLYALSTFGTVLPNTVAAKIGQGQFWPGDPFIQRLIGEWLPIVAAKYGFSATLSLLWPLCLLGLFYAAKLARPLLLIALWTLAFLVGYTLIGAPGYWWYIVPVIFTLQPFIALGLLFFLEQRSLSLKVVGVAMTLFVLVGTLHIGILSLEVYEGDNRAATYIGAAKWLEANSPYRSSVAFVEIGYLGYFSDNRIIDLVGLIEPAFTENGSTLNLASNFWQAEPDYFLYSPDFDWLLGPIVQNERFEEQYQVVAALPSHFTTPLFIYQRIK